MLIRIAQKRDLHQIVNIYNQAVAEGQRTADIDKVSVESRKDWFNAHTKDKYPIIVAVIKDCVVGWLSISPYRPGRLAVRYTAEVSYYIDYSFHRKGIASKLLNEAIRQSPSLQIKTLFAIILETNKDSIALLKKFGFQKWGYMPAIADFNGLEIGHTYYGLRIAP